jgi:hypothetical protein
MSSKRLGQHTKPVRECIRVGCSWGGACSSLPLCCATQPMLVWQLPECCATVRQLPYQHGLWVNMGEAVA